MHQYYGESAPLGWNLAANRGGLRNRAIDPMPTDAGYPLRPIDPIVSERHAAALNDGANGGRLVGFHVVQHNIAEWQMWLDAAPDPLIEPHHCALAASCGASPAIL